MCSQSQFLLSRYSSFSLLQQPRCKPLNLKRVQKKTWSCLLFGAFSKWKLWWWWRLTVRTKRFIWLQQYNGNDFIITLIPTSSSHSKLHSKLSNSKSSFVPKQHVNLSIFPGYLSFSHTTCIYIYIWSFKSSNHQKCVNSIHWHLKSLIC